MKEFEKLKKQNLPFLRVDDKFGTCFWALYLKKDKTYEVSRLLDELLGNLAKVGWGNNKLVDLYSEYGQVTYSKLMVYAIISKEKDYEIYVNYPFSRSRVGEKILISDSDGYRCAIKVISEEIMPFDKLSSDMVNYKLGGFNSFLEYKNSLFLKFVEDAKIFNEIFNNESMISYVKFEVIDKF